MNIFNRDLENLSSPNGGFLKLVTSLLQVSRNK
jgi:hypothetical protein